MPIVTVLLTVGFATLVHMQVAASRTKELSIAPPASQQPVPPTSTPSSPTPPKPKPAKLKPKPKVVATIVPKYVTTSKSKSIKKIIPAPSSKVKHLEPKPPSGGSGPTPTPNPSTPATYYSTNWSGYFASGKSYTSISGLWAVPTATGDGVNTTADATWIGIGGVNSNDLIQTGTFNFIDPNGTVTSQAFYELLPDAAIMIPDITVSAGDSMSASVSKISTGLWSISITDNTNNENFTTTVAYNSTMSSAEWIEEDPSYGNGQLVPFDNFGIATFTGSTTTASGVSQNLTSSKANEIILVDNSLNPLATPSAVTSGTNFTVTHN